MIFRGRHGTNKSKTAKYVPVYDKGRYTQRLNLILYISVFFGIPGTFRLIRLLDIFTLCNKIDNKTLNILITIILRTGSVAIRLRHLFINFHLRDPCECVPFEPTKAQLFSLRKRDFFSDKCLTI